MIGTRGRFSVIFQPAVGHSAGVLLLSRMIGQEVRGPDDRALGRLADLTVGLDEHAGGSLAARILLHRRHECDLLVPWSAVGSIKPGYIQLTSDAAGLAVVTIADVLDSDEILLARDVLDTQIVDVVGQRLTRVADVLLARRPNGHLELVGVEVGFGAMLRRLGLDGLAKRMPSDAVAWSDLHLTSARGHSVQLATPRSAVHHLDARALAMLVARLGTEAATEVLASKGPELAAEVIRASHQVVGERVLRAMADADAADVVAAMPAHHARHWRHLLANPRILRGERFLRSRVWPRRRHVPRDPIR